MSGEKEIGMTTVEEYVQIEEIKGSCPKCGGPLEFREHVDAFNEDGSPIAEDTFRDPYCPSCKLFWLGQLHEGKFPPNISPLKLEVTS